MNLNELAKTITLSEGGKISISIAQVKEVMKILFRELNEYSDEDILKTIRRYRGY